MDERVVWKVVECQDVELAATEQVLGGSGQWRRIYGELCFLERNRRIYEPLGIKGTL